MMSFNIHLRLFSREMLKISPLDMSFKITKLKLQLHLPGAQELIWDQLIIPIMQWHHLRSEKKYVIIRFALWRSIQASNYKHNTDNFPAEACHKSGPCFYIKITQHFPGIGIPLIKITRSWDHLIFTILIPILVRKHLIYSKAPCKSG